jgi:ankyrin repeat protein
LDTPSSGSKDDGHLDIVKVLLATEGIDVNVKEKDGQTPLHMVVRNGYLDIVKALLATEGVDVNAEERKRMVDTPSSGSEQWPSGYCQGIVGHRGY